MKCRNKFQYLKLKKIIVPMHLLKYIFLKLIDKENFPWDIKQLHFGSTTALIQTEVFFWLFSSIWIYNYVVNQLKLYVTGIHYFKNNKKTAYQNEASTCGYKHKTKKAKCRKHIMETIRTKIMPFSHYLCNNCTITR